MTLPNNPHDALFRALVDDPGRAGTLIREYLPPEIAAHLAEGPPRLLDGSFVDEELRSSQSDRLFEVALRDGRTALLYALLEHKSTPDPRTPLQLLGYMVRIWDRYAVRDGARLGRLRPILPIVFYHGERPWTVPTSIFECLDADDALLPHIRDLRYVLRDLGAIEYERLSAERALRAGLGALKFAFVKGLAAALLERLLRDLPDGDVLESQVVLYIAGVYDMAAGALRSAVARVKPDRENELMGTPAQEWIQQGRTEGEARGRTDGRFKGRVEGRIDDILIALETRFGPPAAEVVERVRRTAPEHLHLLFRRALTAPSVEAVFDDSVRH